MTNPISSRTVRFGQKWQKKIESTDPRVSGGHRRPGRYQTPTSRRSAAAGHAARSVAQAPLSCPNETARLEIFRLATGSCPARWAYFGARTRERNDVEERPPDAHHGCDHRRARHGTPDLLQCG